jgi:hypothetical protein
MAKTLKSASASCACGDVSRDAAPCGSDACGVALPAPVPSELVNWPVQLRLVPPAAPYLHGADILLAADCVPVAVPDFHARYLKNKPVIIACPKLEDNDPQIAKLAEIVGTASPASITVVRMEVPCCGGLVRVAEEAVARAGTGTPIHTIVVSVDGSELR